MRIKSMEYSGWSVNIRLLSYGWWNIFAKLPCQPFGYAKWSIEQDLSLLRILDVLKWGHIHFFPLKPAKSVKEVFFSQIHLNSNISSFRSNYQQLFNENFLTWSVDLLPYMVLVFYFFFSLRIEKFNQVNCCLKLTFFLFTLSLAHTNLLCAFSLLIALLVQPNQSDSWN